MCSRLGRVLDWAGRRGSGGGVDGEGEMEVMSPSESWKRAVRELREMVKLWSFGSFGGSIDGMAGSSGF